MSVNTIRLIIFLAAYLALAFPRLPGLRLTRPAAALIGATAMIVIGRLPLDAAYAAVDMQVLTFLLGILIMAAYLEMGGFFEWAAIHVARHMRSPLGLLAAIIATTGGLSLLFMNDTICLVLTPLIVRLTRKMGLPPLPYMLALALASNVGSAAAITGNPQNMLIGIASGIGYGEFLVSLAPASLGGLIIVFGVLATAFRQQLTKRRPEIQLFEASGQEAIAFDRGLVLSALIVFAGMLLGWLAHLSLPLVAIGGAALLLLSARRDTADAFRRVDWPLLLFFAALFVIARGVQNIPPVQDLTSATAHLLQQPLFAASKWRSISTVSGVMLVLSNLVSNVPAVLLWRPLVPSLPHPHLIWLTIAVSSTFAGNLSLLGSMANLIVAEGAHREGASMTFLDYLRVGVPTTLLTIGWGIVALIITRSSN